MKALVLALLLLVLPTSAHAYFTVAEYTSMASLVTAAQALSDGYVYLGDNGGTADEKVLGATNSNNNAYVNTGWLQMNLTAFYLAEGSCYLLGQDLYGVLTHSDPRATFVTAGKASIANALTAATAAKNAFNTGVGDVTQTAAFRENMTHLRDVSMGGVVNALTNTWNSSLAYTGGPNVTGGANTIFMPTWPRCYGPHGACDVAVVKMCQAIDAQRQGLDKGRLAWNTPWSDAETQYDAATLHAFARLSFREGSVFPKMMSMLLLYNCVSNSATLQGMPCIRAIQTTYEHLVSESSGSQSRCHCIEGLPYHQDNMGFDVFIYVEEAMVTRPIARAHWHVAWPLVSATFWALSDGSIWQSFLMPGSSQDDATLRTLRATPNEHNDPNGPPILYRRAP